MQSEPLSYVAGIALWVLAATLLIIGAFNSRGIENRASTYILVPLVAITIGAGCFALSLVRREETTPLLAEVV